LGTVLALALYALLLAGGSCLVWRRPVAALYAWIVGLALHNSVMAALYAAGLRGSALGAVQAWKEILLAVAVARVLVDAARMRRLPFRRELPDWLALAFGILVLVYALLPQHVLGGLADRKTVAYALRHDGVPVVVFLLFRALACRPGEARRFAATLLATAGVAALAGLVDVYAIPIGWWRTNGVVDYFHRQLGYDYHGTGGLPENFVFNTGSERDFLRRLVSVFLSPLAASYLFVVALLAASVDALRPRVAVPLAAAVFAGLLFTFSRASLFALAAGLVVVAAARRRPWPLAAAAVVVAVTIGWAHVFPHVGPTGRWTRADLVLQRANAKRLGGVCKAGALSACEPSIQSHLTNLREGIRTVVHHPQGYGLGNAGQAAKRSGTPLRAGESNYTELGVETGLLGAVLWTLWGLSILAWLLRARGLAAAATAAAFAAILVLAVQSDVIGDPWVAYCVWALAGLFAARGTSRVPVALNDAVADRPSTSDSRSAEAAVTSAVTGPMRTRTRLPRVATERISPRRWFRAESLSGAAGATATSQG
jgi:hypothetical protein